MFFIAATPQVKAAAGSASGCAWRLIRYLPTATTSTAPGAGAGRAARKILHETPRRRDAATGEVPFGCYYGSIDSTPLFLMLGGAYLERTADLQLVQALWPHFERAVAWMDHHGDIDGDGFVEYARMTDRGLANQGWKDSHDAVFHDDGHLAEGPIALCECGRPLWTFVVEGVSRLFTLRAERTSRTRDLKRLGLISKSLFTL